jgi:hypothetical protein
MNDTVNGRYRLLGLQRGKTPGVDNVTVEDYEEDLEANLRDLLGRLHRGSYRPRPSLRKNIPKGNGKTRALGIACFEVESDAVRYQAVLPKRLDRFSLSVAQEKTKLLRFGRFAGRDHQRSGKGAPGTFDFLGFTHDCGQSRAGKFKLKRKTSGKKMRLKLMEMRLWFHHQLTIPIVEMWQLLSAKLRGHYQYYGINDNWPMPEVFRRKVRRMAKRHLSRRSQNSYVNWAAFNRFTDLHPLVGPQRLMDLIALDCLLWSATAS